MPHSITSWLDVRFTEEEIEIIVRLLALNLDSEIEAIIETIQTHKQPMAELIVPPLPRRNDPLEDFPL